MKRILIVGAIAGLLVAVSIAMLATQQGSPVPSVPAPVLTPDSMPARFSEAVNLTNNTRDSVYGQVVASDETVYVVWQDSVPSGQSPDGRYFSGNYDIFMMQSLDSGRTFGTAVNLSNNHGFSEHPQTSAYEESLYVVWADNTSGNKEVMFAKSDDSGENFGSEINLSTSLDDSFNQEIAVHENNVYVVWLEEGQSSSEVMLRTSRDGGDSFGDSVVVSENAAPSTLPKVAADSQGAHVVWSRLDESEMRGLYYASALDGSAIGEAKKLAAADELGEPQVIAGHGALYVISGGQDKIGVDGLFLATSRDGGETFSSEIIDVNGTFVNPLNVEAAAGDDSVLYVAGQVFSSDNEEILLLPILVGPEGTTVLGLSDLSNNEKISECPSIAISGENIFVVWEDLSPGNHEVLYARGEKI